MSSDLQTSATRLVSGGADFSRDRAYRYALWRQWGAAPHRTVTFIGLNPSTADETEDDPTIRRCLGFAKKWDGTRLVMLNLFALRSTDPRALLSHLDPIGLENDHYLRSRTEHSAIVVAAWGVHGEVRGRGAIVLENLGDAGVRLQCLGLTKDRHPKHPLYLSRDCKLEEYVG